MCAFIYYSVVYLTEPETNGPTQSAGNDTPAPSDSEGAEPIAARQCGCLKYGRKDLRDDSKKKSFLTFFNRRGKEGPFPTRRPQPISNELFPRMGRPFSGKEGWSIGLFFRNKLLEQSAKTNGGSFRNDP